MIDDPFARGIDVPPFYAGQISREAMKLARTGREIIPMHFGQPTIGPPPAVLDAARRALSSNGLGYWESDDLRERIAQHYRDTYAVHVLPEQILLTSGASAGLVAIFTSLFKVGDRIAVARPGYPAYRNALNALQRTVVEIDCGPESGFQLTARHIEALPEAPHGLIIASPSNPTGAVIAPDALRAIVDVCRDRNIRLISDEIYHGITYGAEAKTALAFHADAIVVNSFSKLYRMPGWRLGWIVVPTLYRHRVQSHLTNLFLTPPALSQQAALAAFDSPDDLRCAVSTYARNRDLLLNALPGLGFPRITSPDGAFYIYADVSHLTDDSLAFCRSLLVDVGVAIAPGIDFDPINGNSFVRMSFAGATAQIERAVELLASEKTGLSAMDRNQQTRAGHP
jgi:aspartate/methionine/tyrosine aminotransferase